MYPPSGVTCVPSIGAVVGNPSDVAALLMLLVITATNKMHTHNSIVFIFCLYHNYTARK